MNKLFCRLRDRLFPPIAIEVAQTPGADLKTIQAAVAFCASKNKGFHLHRYYVLFKKGTYDIRGNQ